jgi:hypothetical protein
MNAMAPSIATAATSCTKPANPGREKPGLGQSRCEGSEAYFRVIALCGNYRVILCKDAIQWIIQRRIRGRARGAGARWKACGYLTTKSALIRLWHAKTALPLPPEIENLPAKIIRNAD